MRQFTTAALILLLMSGVSPAKPVEHWKVEKLDRIKVDYRKVPTSHRLESLRREERERLLKEAAAIDYDKALKWVVSVTRDCGDSLLQRAMLRHLARKEPEAALVIGLFREIATTNSDNRALARDFLLEWAVKENQQPWLVRLFQTGSMEEKFLAVQAMGRTASSATIENGWKLLEDRSWKPAPRGIVNAGTLARAMQSLEGEAAACFLLLLERDNRFRDEDTEAVRHATRLWKHADLKRYISLRALADPDSQRRQEVARFMGRAGFEAARAPLLALAKDRKERMEVRVAATEALGGMRLSRGAMTRELKKLLQDPEPKVREAAVRALGRLNVRQSAAVLLELFDTPLGKGARAELAAHNGLPEQTDWAEWLHGTVCPLPEGT
ncbi:MAG: HEAT repeat domain-containing protein [Planctomycetota bacterium]|jgi:HEAT repeat protein